MYELRAAKLTSDIYYLSQKGEQISTQSPSFMSIAVGSAASREEMAAAQRTGSHLAGEFLKSSAKEMLITAKVSTENSILQERSRRELQAWMYWKRGFIHVRGFGRIIWLKEWLFVTQRRAHVGFLSVYSFVRLSFGLFVYLYVCYVYKCMCCNVASSQLFCERPQQRM